MNTFSAPETGTSVADDVDSDGDGITDAIEAEGCIGTAGERYRTDSKNSDFDGDSFSDGGEAGESMPDRGTASIYVGTSNPLTTDPDGDGLSAFRRFVAGKMNKAGIPQASYEGGLR